MDNQIKVGDVLPPSTKARWFVVIYAVVILILFMLFLDRLSVVEVLIAGADEQLAAAIAQLQSLFYQLLIFTVLHALVLSYLLVKSARESFKQGIFPTSCDWVLITTEVKGATDAKRSAWLCILLAIVSWLPIAIPIYLSYLLHFIMG